MWSLTGGSIVGLFVCVFDDQSAALSLELSKWLEPLEKLRFELGSIPIVIDYVKQVQNSNSIKSTFSLTELPAAVNSNKPRQLTELGGCQ